MCNRYSLSKKQERIITREHGSVEFYFMQRFNIAPTQMAQVLVLENGRLLVREMRWGWSTRVGLLTNAQSETAHEKLFKEALIGHRCLVPADGSYEWKAGKPAQPFRFVLPSGAVFWMAGLWRKSAAGKNSSQDQVNQPKLSAWHASVLGERAGVSDRAPREDPVPQNSPAEFTILTATGRGLVRSFHDRMPVILPESELETWLADPVDRLIGPDGLLSRGLFKRVEAYPVTTQMSNPRFESPQAIEPIRIAQGELF